jgi:glyoxylase-like metal-dependent hydrolase (beta-lactamase superfamily II)
MSVTQVPAVEAFYHALTGAYAYLVHDPHTLQAVVVDPVLDFDRRCGVVSAVAAEQMLARIRELQLQVQWVLETHAHADHLSAAAYMKDALGCPVATGVGVCDVQITAAHMFDLEPDFPTDGSQFEHLWNDGDRFRLGEIACSVLATPGHTPDSVTYLIGDCAFVGDTLFLPYLGTARCDFPGASAHDLYDSIRKLYRLPDATRVLVGHDYPQGAQDPSGARSHVTVAGAVLLRVAGQRAGRALSAGSGQRHAPAARTDSSAADLERLIWFFSRRCGGPCVPAVPCRRTIAPPHRNRSGVAARRAGPGA